MLDKQKLPRDERDDALEEIAIAAEACLEGDGTIQNFNETVHYARISGYLNNLGPVRASRILRGRSPAVQGLVLEEFSEKDAEEITLIINATDEHEGLLMAQRAMKSCQKPEFINFVKGFPEDFLTVYVTLRDDCEKTMSLLMDKARELGFEFSYYEDQATWECYRFRDDQGHFEMVASVQTDSYVHSGILALICARIYELETALNDLKLCEFGSDA
jgi:hypothetical protein